MMKCKIIFFGFLTLVLLSIGTTTTWAKDEKTGKFQFKEDVENTYETQKKEVTINLDLNKLGLLVSLFNDDTVPFTKVDSLLFSKIDVLNGRVSNLNDRVSELKTGEGERKTIGGAPLWVVIAFCSLAFLFILFVVYFFIIQGELRDKVKKIVKGSVSIKEWLDDSYEKKGQLVQKSYDSVIRSLQNENLDLKNRVAALEDTIRRSETMVKEISSTNHQGPTSAPMASAPMASAPKLLYADSIIDGMFSHVRNQEDEDTIFVLRLKNESFSFVTIHRSAYGKVLANASYLEGCDKQILGNSSVEIVREGEAELTPSGKWRIVTPMKVEIR